MRFAISGALLGAPTLLGCDGAEATVNEPVPTTNEVLVLEDTPNEVQESEEVTVSPPGTETPGTETPGTETPGTEMPGTETPGTERGAPDEPEAEAPPAPGE